MDLLDPDQNKSFVDLYVNFPIDLSKVFWICTANYYDRIPAPLLDRLEIVHIPGYFEHEKVNIAQNFLIPKELRFFGA